MVNHWRLLPTIVVGALVLGGCAPVMVGGAAVGATSMALDRRSAGTQVDDEAIKLKAYESVRRDPELTSAAPPEYLDPTAPPPAELSHVEVTVYNGVVLLTGEVPSEAAHERTGERIKTIEKVQRVYNELTVAPPSSTESRQKDSLISAKVRTRMLLEKDFDSDAVAVTTTGGTVYLMGLVSRNEAEKATAIARNTVNVVRVVRLFELLD